MYNTCSMQRSLRCARMLSMVCCVVDGGVPVADEVYFAYYILRREAEHTRIRTQAVVCSTPFLPIRQVGLWPSDPESGVLVMFHMGYVCANFSLLRQCLFWASIGELFPPNILKSPKNLLFFFVFGPKIMHYYKKLTIKLLFNFNNFNSRLSASSQHHIKYFNHKKAHPCVIPRIVSHHASKSDKAFDLCACLKMWNKKLLVYGVFAPRLSDQGLCPWTPLGAGT